MGKTYRKVSNEDMAEGFRELRKGSRAQPHRRRDRYRRADWRNKVQSGKVDA